MMCSILFLKFTGGGEKNGKNAVFIFVNTELDIIVTTSVEKPGTSFFNPEKADKA